MFDITQEPGGEIRLIGRLDAVSVPVARELLAGVEQTTRIDFTDLEYIASAGLGLLAATQRRLLDKGEGLVLCSLNPHLREVVSLAGFEGVFEFD